MRTAFVTGGSGFIGGRLIERLAGEGRRVRALVRSDAAAERVEELGAEAVLGGLGDISAVAAGARGCEVCFHAAARVGAWGPWAEFEEVNVRGTRTVLRACREAGVARLVHVGTEAALMRGAPLVLVDESEPLALRSPVAYARSKALAERAVLCEAGGLATVVVRPRLVWGRGDTTVLPSLVAAARAARLRFIGGGRQLTSTTHVDNAVHALVLAAERGRPGSAYFATDGPPVVFREWVGALLRTQGIEPPAGTLPLPAARALAAVLEGAWRAGRLPGEPPLTRLAVWIGGLEATLVDERARRELGYAPVTGRDAGLAELRAGAPGWAPEGPGTGAPGWAPEGPGTGAPG